MVPRGLGDGSIIGTTVLSSQQPQNQHQSQPQPQHSGTVSRQVKGILKRAPVNPNQESVQQPLSGGSASMASTASTAGSSAGGGTSSQNKWDYELSPSSTDTTNKSEQHGGHGHGGQHGHGGHGHGLHHHHHHSSGGGGGSGGGSGGGNRGEPDILQLPMGLPPPPGTSAISGKVEKLYERLYVLKSLLIH